MSEIKGVGSGRPAIPDYVRKPLERAGALVTQGLPRETWNGMTPDLHEVGQTRGGPRRVHLLLPGAHPATAAEAKEHFAWNEHRARLWDEELLPAARRLQQEYGVTHLAGAGSYFTTDWPFPGDVDVVAFTDAEQSRLNWEKLGRSGGAQPYEPFNRRQPENSVHAYAPDASIFFPGGPSSLYGFRFAPPSPRPATPVLGGASGPEVGLVLLDVDELLRSSANDDVER